MTFMLMLTLVLEKGSVAGVGGQAPYAVESESCKVEGVSGRNRSAE